VSHVADTYAAGNSGEPIAYVGSSGYVEIAVNKGNAAKTLAISRGAPVILEKK
jgi:S-adenosylmethionine hydrolase